MLRKADYNAAIFVAAALGLFFIGADHGRAAARGQELGETL
jgi:hypothetical protein